MKFAQWSIVALSALFTVINVTTLFIGESKASVPGTKWGTQVEVGTIGNGVAYKVVDEGLNCLVIQPRNGSSPALYCIGNP